MAVVGALFNIGYQASYNFRSKKDAFNTTVGGALVGAFAGLRQQGQSTNTNAAQRRVTLISEKELPFQPVSGILSVALNGGFVDLRDYLGPTPALIKKNGYLYDWVHLNLLGYERETSIILNMVK